jgi:prephenate dehydrogenase
MALAARVAPELAFVGATWWRRAAAGAEPAADALQGALFYLVAPAGAAADSLERAANLAEAVGARPCFVDAAEHDAIVAATATLPLLGAAAMMRLLRGEPGWPDRAQGHHRRIGRPAVPWPRSIRRCRPGTRRQWRALARWLALYRAEIDRWQALLAAGDAEGLRAALAAAGEAAEELAGASGEPEPAPEGAMGGWRQFLLGRFGAMLGKRRA